MSGHEEVPTATRLALVIARSVAAGVSRDGLCKVVRLSAKTVEDLLTLLQGMIEVFNQVLDILYAH